MHVDLPLEPINLKSGWPATQLHPVKDLQEASAALFSRPDFADRLRYNNGSGDPALRQNLSQWLSDEYRPVAGPVTADRVALTNGASNGLATILQKFTDPGYTRHVWVVEPTYYLASQIFRDAGFSARFRAVPEQADGPDLAFLEKSLAECEGDGGSGGIPEDKSKKHGYPKIYRHVLYLVPTFSNPSGRTMGTMARIKLVEMARRFDVLLIADDVYDFLRWNDGPDGRVIVPQPPLRLVDVDRKLSGANSFGNAVSNGSFSKLVAPGVRVGWLEGTPRFISTMNSVGATASGGCQSQMSSLIINEMLANGSLRRHIRDTLIPSYRRRREALVDAIRHHLVPMGVELVGDSRQASEPDKPQMLLMGGFFAYLVLPENIPHASFIAEEAERRYNLTIAPGDLFEVDDESSAGAERPLNLCRTVRLCWAWHAEPQLRDGVRRLAALLKDAAEYASSTRSTS